MQNSRNWENIQSNDAFCDVFVVFVEASLLREISRTDVCTWRWDFFFPQNLHSFLNSWICRLITAMILNSEWLKANPSSFTERKLYSVMKTSLPSKWSLGNLRNDGRGSSEDVTPKYKFTSFVIQILSKSRMGRKCLILKLTRTD